LQGLGSGLLVLWLRSPNNNNDNNAKNVNNDGNINNNNVNNNNVGVRPDFNPQGTSRPRVYADCLCGILREHRGRVQD